MDTLRPALFLGYALSLGTLAALGQILVCTGWRRIPLQRRAFIRDRMVRFSRLLGKFDTTAHGATSQVGDKSTVTQSGNPSYLYAQNAASRRSGVLRFRAGHWPPQQIMAGGVSTVPIAKHPRSDFPFLGRSLAVALTECLLLCGLAGVIFQQPVHHWRPLNSNPWAVSCRVMCNLFSIS
jgi:hypothetical protein